MITITKNELNQMPSYVAECVASDLKCYDKTNIIYFNGIYHISTAICLMDKYPDDYKFIGTIFVEDFYSLRERIENYINAFHDYPQMYKGNRNYSVLHKMDTKEFNHLENGKLEIIEWQGKLNNLGNFELTHQKKYIV